MNQIYKVTNNRYTPNTKIPTQTLKINLKTIYIIQTHKIKNTKEIHKYKYKSNGKHKLPITMYKSTNNYNVPKKNLKIGRGKYCC